MKSFIVFVSGGHIILEAYTFEQAIAQAEEAGYIVVKGQTSLTT